MTAQPAQPTTHAAPDAYDRQQLLELIEDATRDLTFCACGELMTVDAAADTLWLTCPALTEPSAGRLAWLRGGLRTVFHERQVIAREVGLAA